MTEKTKSALIGAFILLACLAMLGVLLFVRPKIGDGDKILYICFTSVEKIQVGTRVTFAGNPVGEVVAIDEIYDARNQPVDRHQHICFYKLKLAIDSHVVVYSTDEISIHTTGLLGERTIAITPKPPQKGVASYPITDQVMYGNSADPVEAMLNQIASIGGKASGALDAIRDVIEKNKDEITATIISFQHAADQVTQSFATLNEMQLIQKLSDDLPPAIASIHRTSEAMELTLNEANKEELVAHLDQGARSFSTLCANACALINSWREGGLGESLPKLTSHLERISIELDQEGEYRAILKGLRQTCDNFSCASKSACTTVDNFEAISKKFLAFSKNVSPKSTFGRLFSDDDFYLQMTALLAKSNVLLDDVNHYGVLFHLNKNWQRERERRMNLLNKLCRAQDFRNYFEDEVDQMYLSLGRISRAMQRAECNRKMGKVLKDQEFTSGLQELIDRIDQVHETLEVYQNQLIETHCRHD